MVEDPIELSQVLSPQEEMFAGLVPKRPYDRRTWYVPNGVTDGVLTVPQVVRGREEIPFVLTRSAKIILGARDIGFNLPPLSTRGRTVRDPVLVEGMIEYMASGRQRLDGVDRTRLLEAVYGGEGSLHLRRASMARYYPHARRGKK